jgi:hypothetical protein
MSSKKMDPKKVSKAELKFRDAFQRLKDGKPNILPNGTTLSQNNVAKEAGVDPSALRRVRFPELVSEIKLWVDAHKDEAPKKSSRQMMLAQRSRSRDLKEKYKALEVQRDKALGQLLDAQACILELTLENQRLRAQLPVSKVRHLPVPNNLT